MTCFRCNEYAEVGEGVCTEATGRLCQDCSDEVNWREIDEPAQWLSDDWLRQYWPDYVDD